MSGFEERVRAGLDGAADEYEPSPSLRGEVDRRMRHHRRARVVWAAASAVGAVVLVAGLGVLLATDDEGNQADGYAGTSLPGATVPVGDVEDDDDGPVPCDDWPRYGLVVSSITERYVGLTEVEAESQAEAEFRDLRVVCRDGSLVPKYRDLLAGGLDVQIVDGVVVAVLVAPGEFPPASLNGVFDATTVPDD